MPYIGGEGVGVSGRECVGRDIALRCPDAAARRPYPADAPHGIENVQPPAALGDGNVFQRFDALEFFPHFLRRNDWRGTGFQPVMGE